MSLGQLYVISAPSGAGKSTLCHKLVQRRKNLAFSISVTTRMPRPGERDGKDYFFVTEAVFYQMRQKKQLVEWAIVHGQYYGTPREFLERKRREGKDILLDIDVQGAMSVKKNFPNAILIFITTPTFSDLEKRLWARSSESKSEIERRLTEARRELSYLPQYDYQVINERIDVALKALGAILTAESLRIRPLKEK